MILNLKLVLAIFATATGFAAACKSDNDCSGSDVCCTANFGEGGIASLCIAQHSCVNGGCFQSFGGRMAEGSCDGG